MSQQRLWYEDEYEAFAAMIGASGKTQKECALHMWPEMKAPTAIAKLQSRLDRKGDEKFTFAQVVALMNFCGTYDPLMYGCDETLHARPDRKAPADQEQRLVETIDNATHVMTRALQELNLMRRVRGVA